MRTSILRVALIAGALSLLAACGSPTAPSTAVSHSSPGANNRAPFSIDVTAGTGVTRNGGLSDGAPPPEITVVKQDGTVHLPPGTWGLRNTECSGNVIFHANDSVTITQGQGAALNDGSATNGCPPPEIVIILHDGSTFRPGNGAPPR